MRLNRPTPMCKTALISLWTMRHEEHKTFYIWSNIIYHWHQISIGTLKESNTDNCSLKLITIFTT